jgi:dinuclear metal center YbgI/SA1388 family protein
VTTVRDLVGFLDDRLPFSWAEPWDRVGLLAGDPSAEVVRIFVSLDPTVSALRRARDAGANVLLTHHPAILDPVETVRPDTETAILFEALASGVALVNCHTNLDRAPEGADALALAVGLAIESALEAPGEDAERPRAGRVCSVAEGTTLRSFAEVVGETLGVRPRVWGDPNAPVSRVGLAPGSGRSLVEDAKAAGCDALLTGELRYHGALAALESGLLVIEAGHDATEWPLTAVLADITRTLPGFSPESVILDRPHVSWWVA